MAIVMESTASTLMQPVLIKDKVVLVTGASSGIGEAISKLLTKAGAKVCIAASRPVRLSTVRERIEQDGGKAFQFELDVTNHKQFSEVVKAVQEEVGPIDILINNAGVMFYTYMRNVMINDWDKMIDINCRGVTNGIACVLPGMVQRNNGHIMNMSSDAGRKSFPGLAVYSATKFFVEGISQGLRHEVKDKGIRVTSIQPGDCCTEIFDYTTDKNAAKRYATSGVGEVLVPEDVARAVLYALTQPEHVAVNEILIEPRDIQAEMKSYVST